jgi:secreted trypsin-like serine protease
MTISKLRAAFLGSALAATLGGAGLLAAQGMAPDHDGATSPFAFAQSGAKAERDAALPGGEGAVAEAARGIGGRPAAEGAWPWQVALMVAGQPTGPDAQYCGGSMLLDEWVLTAAHCVHMADANGNYFDLRPEMFDVFVGSSLLAPGRGDRVPVRSVHVFPGYDGTEFDNDVALIRLARKPNAPYQTIQIPTAEFAEILDQPDVPAVVTGWGLIEGARSTPQLYQVEIQILGRDLCNRTMMEARGAEAMKGFSYATEVFGLKDEDAQAAWNELVRRAPLPVTQNMVCAGTYEGGKTSCNGDSGGPLVVPLTDGSYIQVGIVSWGLTAGDSRTCDERALFSAYTKVSNYIDWLEATIARTP